MVPDESIYCPNCGWEGEQDDLDWDDGDAMCPNCGEYLNYWEPEY